MLKKIVLTLAIVAFASNAFAVTTCTFPDNVVPTGLNFVPSKSVLLGYVASAGGGGGTNAVYCIGSKNTAGDKAYGTSSASTAISWQNQAAGSTLGTTGVGLPATPSDSAIVAGWSTL